MFDEYHIKWLQSPILFDFMASPKFMLTLWGICQLVPPFVIQQSASDLGPPRSVGMSRAVTNGDDDHGVTGEVWHDGPALPALLQTAGGNFLPERGKKVDQV